VVTLNTMINQDSNTEEALVGLLNGNLTYAEIVALFNHSKFTPSELIEKVSLKIALKYWNREISYQSGDIIMNRLISCMPDEISSVSWECYLAFDAGEFYRPTDHQTVDPVEKYTKPLIETLLKKYNLIP